MSRPIAFALALMICLCSAYADRIDTLIRRLQSSRTKTRLSAALVLGKSRDIRSLNALTKSLRRDSNRLVRLSAAAALGTMIPKMNSPKGVDKAMAMLRRAQSKDSSKKVRRRAMRVLSKLGAGQPQTIQDPNLYFVLERPRGDLSTQSKRNIVTRVSRILKSQKQFRIGTKQKVSQRRTFVLSGRLSFTKPKQRKNTSALGCKISLRASPFTSDGETWRSKESAIATASANVIGSSTHHGIEQSKEQCASAAMEAATKKQMIPFLRKQASLR